ncbi:Transmembrane protein 5 [Chamberlinius hualienensis]
MFITKQPWWKRICALIFVIYLIFTLYSAYLVLYKDDQLSSYRGTSVFKPPEQTAITRSPKFSQFLPKNQQKNSRSDDKHIVHIWGKAAIGLYLWEHVLGGSIDTSDNGLTYNGTLHSDRIEFRFLTGPGVVQGHVATDIKYLVLVINGREDNKISYARTWLDYLDYIPSLERVAVVMLGNEQCKNDWIVDYVKRRSGKVRAVWITYDSPLVDNVLFYQWPLGVATYRNFPRMDPSQVDVDTPRSNLCNFIGTVYPQSSRVDLVTALNSSSNPCLLKLRQTWQPEETDESLVSYVTALLDSDITLSPVGFNSECYRIYEALACGSVPVMEDVMTEGECGGRAKTPYRLLKLHNAPVIYVKNWEKELPRLLERHRRLPNKVKAKLRLKVLAWYHNFITYLKKHFIKVIKNRLLMQ